MFAAFLITIALVVVFIAVAFVLESLNVDHERLKNAVLFIIILAGAVFIYYIVGKFLISDLNSCMPFEGRMH